MLSRRQQMINEAMPHRKIFEEFCASMPYKSIATKKTYFGVLERYIRYLEEKRIEKPTEATITAYKVYLKDDRKCHGASLQLNNIVLRKFYKWTDRMEYYPNLAIDLQAETIEPTFKRHDLTVDEANKLLDYVAEQSKKGIIGLRDYTIIYLILNIGLRTIEVSRSDIQDIKSIGGCNYLFVQGKGHTDKDTPIKLVNGVYDAIQDYLKARKAPDNGPIFINHGNHKPKERIQPKVISLMVKNYLVANGFNDKALTAHSLRHTCATIALANGASLEEVQHLLRHKSINTTMIYVHTVNERNNRSPDFVNAKLHKKSYRFERK